MNHNTNIVPFGTNAVAAHVKNNGNHGVNNGSNLALNDTV